MGLSVTIYRGIKEASVEDFDFRAYVIDQDWGDRIKNLTPNGYYKADESYSGVSYPCSTHNDFRRELCKLIGKDPDAWIVDYKDWDMSLPFSEFFQFADNDGCIDWETADKLLNDFVDYTDRAELALSAFYLEIYTTWMKTFYRASNKGVIVYL